MKIFITLLILVNLVLADTAIKGSFNSVSNSTIEVIMNDPKLVAKHTQLKNVLEVLFGKDYDIFLKEQKKTNTQFIIYLSKILNNKNIFETVEILKEEITKREKLQKELETAKKQAISQRLKEILPRAEKALAEFRYEDYHKILSEFRDLTKESIKNTMKDIAKSYYLEALAYHDRLEYKKALEYMQKSVNFDEENTRYLNKYGQYLDNLAQYNEAINYFQKALKIDLENFGDKHLNIAREYNNLGEAYRNKGEYDKAIEFYNKALEIDLKNLGDNHPYIAILYNNLGLAYYSKGEYDKAIKYYKKSLEIDLKNLGDNHPQIATYYNNLGFAYDNKGKYKRAIYYYEETLKIYEHIFKNGNHPTVKMVKDNLQSAKEALKKSKSN